MLNFSMCITQLCHIRIWMDLGTCSKQTVGTKHIDIDMFIDMCINILITEYPKVRKLGLRLNTIKRRHTCTQFYCYILY